MTAEMIAAKHIVERLHMNGNHAVWAGGCVRDKLLGLTPNDIDIATDALPDDVENIFPHTIPVGKQFGVIIVLDSGFQFEVATFRKDSDSSDGRRPDSVEFSSMKEDALRRDLTINGMFFDPMTNKIYDFVHGQRDLENKMIRFIGDPIERIKEDKLRMLRAIRFAAKFNFTLDGDTLEAIQMNAHSIDGVSPERIKNEMDKILSLDGPSAAKGIQLLKDSLLLHEILPEVDILDEVEQSPKWHSEGNAFVHTLKLLKHMDTKDSVLGWAALLHDTGKAECFQIEDGVIKSKGHEKKSAEIAESVMRGFKSSNEEREEVVALVRDHMKIKNVKEMKKSTLRKLIASSHFDRLKKLGKLDSLATKPVDLHRNSHKLDWLTFIEDFEDSVEDVRTLPPPLITGHDLIKMGLKPGPKFREILDGISELQLNGEIDSVAEALAIAKKEVRL